MRPPTPEAAGEAAVAGLDLAIDGEGPPIVMLHGWPDTRRLWEPQVLRDALPLPALHPARFRHRLCAARAGPRVAPGPAS